MSTVKSDLSEQEIKALIRFKANEIQNITALYSDDRSTVAILDAAERICLLCGQLNKVRSITEPK